MYKYIGAFTSEAEGSDLDTLLGSQTIKLSILSVRSGVQLPSERFSLFCAHVKQGVVNKVGSESSLRPF